MIAFVNNFFSIDIYDNKMNGIFVLLDDQCKQRSPNVARFTENVHHFWKKHTSFKASASTLSHKHEFTICHFAKHVCYSTVIGYQ